jgi:hypothetical protein
VKIIVVALDDKGERVEWKDTCSSWDYVLTHYMRDKYRRVDIQPTPYHGTAHTLVTLFQ